MEASCERRLDKGEIATAGRLLAQHETTFFRHVGRLRRLPFTRRNDGVRCLYLELFARWSVRVKCAGAGVFQAKLPRI
jgi:hypothetical protein